MFEFVEGDGHSSVIRHGCPVAVFKGIPCRCFREGINNFDFACKKKMGEKNSFRHHPRRLLLLKYRCVYTKLSWLDRFLRLSRMETINRVDIIKRHTMLGLKQKLQKHEFITYTRQTYLAHILHSLTSCRKRAVHELHKQI